MKHLLINLGLAVGSVLMFLLMIEFGLRFTGLQTVNPNPPKIYRRSENPGISYELKPNLRNERAYKARVSTNSLGFRSPEPSGAPIVAILGDSIAFGYGVDDDETLSARLQSRVTDTDYQNAAVPGYQLTQQSTAFAEKILPLQPRGVILIFYWNDLDGFLPGILDDEGVLREAGWNPALAICRPIEGAIIGRIPGKCWLDDHSAFYKAIKKVINLRRSKEMQQEERRSAKTSKEPVDLQHLQQYALQLETFSHILPSRRYFVIWPDNHLHETAKPQLIASAENAGFEVIDLYEIFGNAAPTLPWDTVHPSPEAIESAAAAIAERFR